MGRAFVIANPGRIHDEVKFWMQTKFFGLGFVLLEERVTATGIRYSPLCSSSNNVVRDGYTYSISASRYRSFKLMPLFLLNLCPSPHHGCLDDFRNPFGYFLPKTSKKGFVPGSFTFWFWHPRKELESRATGPRFPSLSRMPKLKT